MTRRVALKRGSVGLRHRLTFEDIVQQHGQPIEFARTTHEVDFGQATKHRLTLTLSQTADHTQNHVAALRLLHLELTNPAEHLVLGLLSHRTGVVEHDVCLVPGGDEPIAKGMQMPTNQLTVKLVHLAAKRLQIDVRPRGTTVHCEVDHGPRMLPATRAVNAQPESLRWPIDTAHA